MSDAHDAHAADAHGADAHHDFDAEPAQELSPGEPRTPGWVPALGLALFMGAGLVFLLRGADDSAAAPEGKPATTASPPAAAPPAAPQRLVPGAGQARPVPPPQGSQPSLQRLSPEQIQQIRQRMQERQPQPGGAGAPGAPGAAPPPPRPAPAPAPAH